jgi:hypothetical protein
MATLKPNKEKLIYSEKGVRSPVGILGTANAYDLALYHDAAGGGKGVLLVTVILQFIYKDGKAADGKKLEWTDPEKKTFSDNYQQEIMNVWNDCFRITTKTTAPILVKDVGVQFDIQIVNKNWYIGDHWELNITKTNEWRSSSVNQFTGGTTHDSEDLTKVCKLDDADKCGKGQGMQRGAVHEFGHMLGLKDEYKTTFGNTNWLSDTESVMNSGETVRDRHYAIFAHWLNKQFETVGRLSGAGKIEWKVNGTCDMSNAKL